MAAALTLVFLVLVVWSLYRRSGEGLRESLLRAAVVWGVLALLCVEILGVLRLLSPGWIALLWSLACAAAGVWAGRQGADVRALRSGLFEIGRVFSVQGPLGALLPGVSLLVLAVGIAAVLSPPGPADAHLYHMPRVLFWLQHRSLAHYPTTYHQQLFQPPWAEFAALHLYALSGGDRLINLIHFAFYLGGALAVYSLAGLLGCQRLGQLTAAVFALTLPQGVLAASGSKNDHAMVFWLLAAAYFAVRCASRFAFRDAVYLGLATGLSLLTKATAYIWAPVAVPAMFLAKGRAGWPALLRAAPIVVIASLAINGPHYARNLALFGSPLGCPAAYCGELYKFTNADFSPSSLVSNLVRNVVLHATTPMAGINRAAYAAGTALVRLAGADPQDPRTTWTREKFSPPAFSTHEAQAGNPLHLVLAIGCVIWLLAARRREAPATLVLVCAAVVGFTAFCWLVRWQPWHVRLHLPFFVMLAPSVGRAGELLLGSARTTGLNVVLLMIAFAFAVSNEVRPLLSASQSLFSAPRDEFYHAPVQMRALASALLRLPCREIGLDVTGPFEIYPLLHWLNVGLGPIKTVYLSSDPRFSGWYRKNPPNPCAVIYNDCVEEPGRATHCRELGIPAVYGSVWLVTGFDAAWTPAQGWAVRQPAATPFYAERGGPVLELPADLRTENAAQLALLAGVTPDKWVTDTGFRVPIAKRDWLALSVRLSGRIPAWSRTLPQTIRLQCGEGPARSQVIEEAGPFQLASTLQCSPGNVVVLDVTPEKFFRPVDLGMSADSRRLSFMLEEVVISPGAHRPQR